MSVKEYGAFVDVGMQTDGLLHISKLSVCGVLILGGYICL